MERAALSAGIAQFMRSRLTAATTSPTAFAMLVTAGPMADRVQLAARGCTKTSLARQTAALVGRGLILQPWDSRSAWIAHRTRTLGIRAHY